MRPTPVALVVIFICGTREWTRIIRRSRMVAEPSQKPAATVLVYESVCQHRWGTQHHQSGDTARNECSLKYAHGSFPLITSNRLLFVPAKQHATSLGKPKDVSAAVGLRRRASGASPRRQHGYGCDGTRNAKRTESNFGSPPSPPPPPLFKIDDAVTPAGTGPAPSLLGRAARARSSLIVHFQSAGCR
jgi:hypothetical protein